MAVDAEQRMEARIRSLGWEVRSVERKHVDVELRAKAGSQPVRLTGLSPFSTAGAVARAVPDPTFFVLSIGEQGEPRRWGGWQQGEQYASSWGGIQCVVSEQGMTVAGGFASLPSTTVTPTDAFFDAIGGVLDQALHPLDAEWPELDPTRGLREWPSRHSRLWRKVGQATLTIAGVGGAVGAVAAGVPQLAPYSFMVGVGAAIAISVDWSRGVVAHGKRVGNATAKRLRSFSSFDEVFPPQVLEAVQLPLIRASAGLRYDDIGSLVRTGVEARSAARGLVLRISTCSSMWPHDALKTCHLLPHTWTVVEARGPSDVLEKFPTRDRMDRKRENLIWLLDERETEGESLWQMLEEVERGLRVGAGGPYR
jgi:hypothetical protein